MFSHYDHEQLVFVEFPDGSTRAAGFDNLGQQLWAVDERGVAVTNSYDSLGRIKGSAYVPYVPEHTMPADVTDLGGCTPTTCQWDMVYGTIDQTIAFTYDQIGNELERVDWAGTFTNGFDTINRPICQYSSISNTQYSILNAFDLAGNRLQANYTIQGSSYQNTCTYDKLNRLSSIQNTGSGIQAFHGYNSNGKPASFAVTNSGTEIHCTRYSYDAENRLAAITNKTGSTLNLSLAHAYNNAQQITSIGEAWGSSTNVQQYTYDGRDQLLSEYQYSSTPSLRFTKSYAYDLAQNRTGSVATIGGVSTPSSYYIQPANKLEAIADDDNDGVSPADEAVNGSSPCAADTDSDGVLDYTEINVSNTCPWLPDSDGDGFADNTDGQPLRPNGAVWFGADAGTPAQGWWRDSTSKPTTGLRTSANHKYYYDRAGNLSTSIVNGVTTVFRYNAQNKLARIEGTGFTYDFAYDSQNRRIAIRKNAEAYRIDIHDGIICIASVQNGTMERFFVKGSGIAEGTGDIIAEIDSGATPHYYVANHRGDTVVVISGATVDRYAYDAFGKPVAVGTPTFAPRLNRCLAWNSEFIRQGNAAND